MHRKSKLIGLIKNDLKAIDSFHQKNDTYLLVECQKCHDQFLIGRKVFLRENSGCKKCGKNYRKYHNAKGYTKTTLYKIYMSILRRTQYCKSDKYHHLYFEKGIKLCKEWNDDFMTFYTWSLNNGFKEGLTIDRIDNSKGYEPSNCRWSNACEQANNRTNNKFIEYNGVRKTYAEWERLNNLSRGTIKNRIKKGWSIESALITPMKRR